jgi:maleylpyruvate isomerase
MLGGTADSRCRATGTGTLPRMTGFADDPDLDLIARETDRLLESAHVLADQDVRQPSRCPGWSRAHVLTHIARNADGLRNVLLAAMNGGDGAFYESQAARNADIEAGSGRTAAELEADLETSADRLLEALAETPVEALDVRVPRLKVNDDPDHQFTIPARKVTDLRLREVVYHHIDLDTGYSFAMATPSWVVREIAESARRFTDGPPVLVDAGEAGSWRYGPAEGEAVRVTGSPAELLGWITGREGGAGLTSSSGELPDLGPWG